jgi:hypothetical protein
MIAGMRKLFFPPFLFDAHRASRCDVKFPKVSSRLMLVHDVHLIHKMHL